MHSQDYVTRWSVDKSVTITMRVKDHHLSIIDFAAKQEGISRTKYMVGAAKEKAKEILDAQR